MADQGLEAKQLTVLHRLHALQSLACHLEGQILGRPDPKPQPSWLQQWACAVWRQLGVRCAGLFNTPSNGDVTAVAVALRQLSALTRLHALQSFAARCEAVLAYRRLPPAAASGPLGNESGAGALDQEAVGAVSVDATALTPRSNLADAYKQWKLTDSPRASRAARKRVMDARALFKDLSDGTSAVQSNGIDDQIATLQRQIEELRKLKEDGHFQRRRQLEKTGAEREEDRNLLEGALSEETQESIKAGLVRTQLEGAVSEETQESVKAGLVRTQLEGALSEETQESIKAGLVRTQLEGAVSAETQESVKAGLVRTQLEGALSEETQERLTDALRPAVTKPAPGPPRAFLLAQLGLKQFVRMKRDRWRQWRAQYLRKPWYWLYDQSAVRIQALLRGRRVRAKYKGLLCAQGLIGQEAVSEGVTQEAVSEGVTQEAVSEGVTQEAVSEGVTQEAVSEGVTQEAVSEGVTRVAALAAAIVSGDSSERECESTKAEPMQLEGAVSEETQESIKAGLVRTQLEIGTSDTDSDTDSERYETPASKADVNEEEECVHQSLVPEVAESISLEQQIQARIEARLMQNDITESSLIEHEATLSKNASTANEMKACARMGVKRFMLDCKSRAATAAAPVRDSSICSEIVCSDMVELDDEEAVGQGRLVGEFDEHQQRDELCAEHQGHGKTFYVHHEGLCPSLVFGRLCPSCLRATVRIQGVMRGGYARRRHRLRQAERARALIHNEAAVRIQAVQRGRKARGVTGKRAGAKHAIMDGPATPASSLPASVDSPRPCEASVEGMRGTVLAAAQQALESSDSFDRKLWESTLFQKYLAQQVTKPCLGI